MKNFFCYYRTNNMSTANLDYSSPFAHILSTDLNHIILIFYLEYIYLLYKINILYIKTKQQLELIITYLWYSYHLGTYLNYIYKKNYPLLNHASLLNDEENHSFWI